MTPKVKIEKQELIVYFTVKQIPDSRVKLLTQKVCLF